MSIVPNYISMDFNTIRDDLIQELRKTETFKDYNFEGSNISILLDLFSYLGELNTFYTNKLAKNLYIDTTELYENIHRLALREGYSPLGYISSETDLTLTLSQGENEYFEIGDLLYVPKHKNFNSKIDVDNNINFISVDDVNHTVSLSYTEEGEPNTITNYEFNILVRQGNLLEYSYFGSDIFNNKISLPFKNFDNKPRLGTGYGDFSIWLEVNGVRWERVNTFLESLSGIDTTYNIFRFLYDKYKRYQINFSPNLSIPKETDEINISLIECLGSEGNVGANTITEIISDNLIYNITRDIWIPNQNISVTNRRGSSDGQNPETTEEIRSKTLNFASSQYRCVSRKDYKNFLEQYGKVLKGTAWGQKELRYNSDVRDYNKVFITIIPTTWNVDTIMTNSETWVVDNGKRTEIMVPDQYLNDFKQELEVYLDPYITTNVYHVYELPELIYFAFDISLVVKQNYNYVSVMSDVKSKLEYLFSGKMRSFGEEIDYKSIEENLRDLDIKSETNSFSNVKGIKFLRIRDIHSNYTVNEPNNSQDFPQYKTDKFDSYMENKLRTILLGPGQFPMLDSSVCEFIKEG